MSTPPKPNFSPTGVPVGMEARLSAYHDGNGNLWWPTRPIIKPRVTVVHTNAAQGEGNVTSAINWGNQSPYGNTHPHWQVDRNQAYRLVPSDRRAIGNSTARHIEEAWDERDSSFWSIVIETADMGTKAAAAAGYPSGDLGPFIGNQVELVAQIVAYEAATWGIPLKPQSVWNQPGTITHTDPFGVGYFTTVSGKTCPGDTKKQQFWDEVLPRAVEIYQAWTAPPEPPKDDEMTDEQLKALTDRLDEVIRLDKEILTQVRGTRNALNNETHGLAELVDTQKNALTQLRWTRGSFGPEKPPAGVEAILELLKERLPS